MRAMVAHSPSLGNTALLSNPGNIKMRRPEHSQLNEPSNSDSRGDMLETKIIDNLMDGSEDLDEQISPVAMKMLKQQQAQHLRINLPVDKTSLISA